MINNDTEILFPLRVLPALRDLRGEEWRALVERVGDQKTEATPERLAFVLMMVRLGGCVACHADAFWAMRGCTACARSTLSRFRGSDGDLTARFDEALDDVQTFLQKRGRI